MTGLHWAGRACIVFVCLRAITDMCILNVCIWLLYCMSRCFYVHMLHHKAAVQCKDLTDLLLFLSCLMSVALAPPPPPPHTLIHCSWAAFFPCLAFHPFLVWNVSALGLCTERHEFDAWSISSTLPVKKRDSSLFFILWKSPFLLESGESACAQSWEIVCQHCHGNHLYQPWHCTVWEN